MKFPKDKTYEDFFISDIHYLLDKRIKNHNHKELFQLLDYFYKRGIRFRRMFLVGDVIENWFFSAEKKLRRSKKRFNKLFDRLDRLLVSDEHKIFIVGNHDATSITMDLPDDIGKYLRKRKWQVMRQYKDKHMIVVHGHQGQYNRLTWALSILFLRFLHGLATIVPRLFYVAEHFYNRHLNHVDPTTASQREKYYNRLARLCQRDDETLICGHTHEFLCIPELKIINTGDWVGSRTFVIRTRRRFMGVQMKGRKEFSREFVLSTGKKKG